MAWPFRHNWSSSYRVTYSFFTDVLTSRSGYEQRIAERVEPRRLIDTTLLADENTARAFDRFLWKTQADSFTHVDPVTGQSSLVRLADTVAVEHPASGVAVSTVTLAVDPGTDTYADPVLDAGVSYQGRYVFPFKANWRGGGAPDSLTLPRQTVDYGRGRISVTRPVPFAARTSTFSLLHGTHDEATTLVDFHRAMRGRQGEFWLPSVLDDLVVLDVVGTTLVIDGADAADMYAADAVNSAVRLEMRSGSVYYRRVQTAQPSGGTTLLSLNADIPEPVNADTLRFCGWMRVGRFASDDLTIEWRTDQVAESQVQAVTLPYVAAENALGLDPLIDYFGWNFFLLFGDPLDYIVNVEAPLVDDVMNRSELAFQFGDPLAYAVNRSAPKVEEYP